MTKRRPFKDLDSVQEALFSGKAEIILHMMKTYLNRPVTKTELVRQVNKFFYPGEVTDEFLAHTAQTEQAFNLLVKCGVIKHVSMRPLGLKKVN